MYIPASFRENRTAVLHQFMKAHPLGLLITGGESGLQVSPLPFMLYPAEGSQGVLRAHMAKANPQWKDLRATGECLVVFNGPDAYITPSWYPGKAETGKAVPTWNYAFVQVRGAPLVIEDAAWLARQIDDFTQYQEGIRPHPWAVGDAPPDYIAAQIQAVTGIEITIHALEGKYKMSQNKDERDQVGVRNGLSNTDDPHCQPHVAAFFDGVG